MFSNILNLEKFETIVWTRSTPWINICKNMKSPSSNFEHMCKFKFLADLQIWSNPHFYTSEPPKTLHLCICLTTLPTEWSKTMGMNSTSFDFWGDDHVENLDRMNSCNVQSNSFISPSSYPSPSPSPLFTDKCPLDPPDSLPPLPSSSSGRCAPSRAATVARTWPVLAGQPQTARLRPKLQA